MYVIAGLGNPGKKYENTRHNIGFITIDHIAETYNIKVDKLKFKSLVGEGRIAGQKVILVKPQTYMNLSGDAIREVMNFYKLDSENLIVIYDDIDIELGALRIRKNGSGGTHNGMRSIVSQLGTRDFPRIRIGIGTSKSKDLVDHVIGNFSKTEKTVLEDTVKSAAASVECMLGSGIDMAMNRFNTGKSKKTEKENE